MSATGIPKVIQLVSGRKKNAALFLDCFRGVIKHAEYWNKWIVDECWIDLINERYEVPEALNFTATQLNGAVARDATLSATGIDKVTSSNSLGVYKSCYRPRGAKRITAYYITAPGKKPSEMPGGNSKWYTTLVSEAPKTVNTRHNPALKHSLPEEFASASTKQAPTRKKRKAIAARGSMKEHVVDLTRDEMSGLFQSTNVQSEKENEDRTPPTFVANKTSADITPNAASRKCNSKPELVGIT